MEYIFINNWKIIYWYGKTCLLETIVSNIGTSSYVYCYNVYFYW